MDEIYKKKIKSLVASNEKFYEIQFFEDVHNVHAIFEDSDLFIRSSNIDSFGISVAEAIQVGTPSIATSVCNRPLGTLLYEAENTNELAILIQNEMKNKDRPRKIIENEYHSYIKIKEVYNFFT